MLLNNVEFTLKAANLPPLTWYDVLVELSRDPDTGIRQFEIGERILLNKHNLSRLIDRLEKEKLLIREVCDADGRGNVVKITNKGLAIRQKMWPFYANAIQSLIANPLGKEKIDLLSELMNLLITNAKQK